MQTLTLLREEALCFIHAIHQSFGNWVSSVADIFTSATAIRHEYVVVVVVVV